MEPKSPGEQIVRAKLLHKVLTEFGACVRGRLNPPASHRCFTFPLLWMDDGWVG